MKCWLNELTSKGIIETQEHLGDGSVEDLRLREGVEGHIHGAWRPC